MNWRHGLLRMWIVLSGIWLATSIWYLDPISHFRMLHRTIILKYDENSFEFPSGFPLTEIKKSLVDWAERRQAEIKRKTANKGQLTADEVIDDGLQPERIANEIIGDYKPNSEPLFIYFA